MTIIIFNNILLTALIALLLIGIAFIARHNIEGKHKKQIIFVLSFWAISMLYYLVTNIHVLMVEKTPFSYNVGFCNIDLILNGMYCFFAVVSYPFIGLYPRITQPKILSIVFLPIVLLIAIYFAWHSLMGVDPFYVYQSAEAMWQNITTMTVILRLLMIATFVVYVTFGLVNGWRIIPIYKSLSKKFYSHSSYDIRWVRTLIIYYTLVSICIILKIFVNSFLLNTLYLALFIALFFYLIEKTLFTRDFEDVNNLGIKWTPKDGWHIPNIEVPEERETINLDTMTTQIDNWMRREKPYTQPHFTSDDIIQEFPKLTSNDLRKIFKAKGLSLHTYIREYRIKEACYIMDRKREQTNLKEVFLAVGFSHYSSFSRAFVQLVGKSPSEYIQQQNNKSTHL